MITNGYEKDVIVRYSEMDFDKSLKPFSLLNFFQDVASDNAEEWGFGYSYITPKNLMWVLLKYRIEFEEYPVGLHDLRVLTEPRGYNKLFAYRDFELYHEKKLMARASSMWSLVDFTNMSIVNVESNLNNPRFSKFQSREDDLTFGKIPQLESSDAEKEYEVRYNDLDVNRHANNGNYIVWALEALDYNFRINHKLKVIDMFFKKEAKLGDTIISKVKHMDKLSTVHVIKNKETLDDLCLIKCEWFEDAR